MSLQSEITSVLIVKVSILFVLKYFFFSDPTQLAIKNSPERVASYFLDLPPELLQGN